MRFTVCVQYMAFVIACFCGLIYTVILETETGHGYAAMFGGLAFGWMGIFSILLCVERCTKNEDEFFSDV
jgi:preprotein translocase subunit SecG